MPVDLVGALEHKEYRLSEAFTRVSLRHADEPELHDACMLLAAWSRSHLQRMAPVLARYAGVRALEVDTDVPVLGEDRRGDLRVLAEMAQDLRQTWRRLADHGDPQSHAELAEACGTALARVDRQLEWLAARGGVPARPDAPVSKPAVDAGGASPEREGVTGAVVSIASLAGAGVLAWTAMAPGVLVAAAGTVWLVFEAPHGRHARFYNSLAGHLLGFVVGATMGLPLIMWSPVPPLLFVVASVAAVVVTAAVARRLDAVHPPAAVTAVLACFGAVTTIRAAIALVAGVVVAAAGGEVLRRLTARDVVREAVQRKASPAPAVDRRQSGRRAA